MKKGVDRQEKTGRPSHNEPYGERMDQIDNSRKWTDSRFLIVPGQPVGKGRPRFARRGAFIKTYTPAKTKAYEHRVAVFWSGPKIASGTPVRVEVVAIFKRPKRLFRKRDPDELVDCLAKPDGDNVLKSVLDALNGVAYEDDNQVVECSVRKCYHEKTVRGTYEGKPRTLVRVSVPTEWGAL